MLNRKFYFLFGMVSVWVFTGKNRNQNVPDIKTILDWFCDQRTKHTTMWQGNVILCKLELEVVQFTFGASINIP